MGITLVVLAVGAISFVAGFVVNGLLRHPGRRTWDGCRESAHDDAVTAILEPLRAFSADLPTTPVGEVAAERCRFVRNALWMVLIERDVTGYPPLSVSHGDDGAISIGWLLPDKRLCIHLETDPREDSWHVVSKMGTGGLLESGRFIRDDAEEVLDRAMDLLKVPK